MFLVVCFSYSDISQGTVAMHFRCAGNFIITLLEIYF